MAKPNIRPIDANELKDKLWEIYQWCKLFSCEERDTPRMRAILMTMVAVDNIPTVDLQNHQPHGKWVQQSADKSLMACSHYHALDDIYKKRYFHYCPRCGAKMED